MVYRKLPEALSQKDTQRGRQGEGETKETVKASS